jgi:hypothetical protein
MANIGNPIIIQHAQALREFAELKLQVCKKAHDLKGAWFAAGINTATGDAGSDFVDGTQATAVDVAQLMDEALEMDTEFTEAKENKLYSYIAKHKAGPIVEVPE